MTYHEHRGAIYLGLGWALTSLVVVAYSFRIYSRALLTRSLGSDDVAITIPVVRSASHSLSYNLILLT